MNKRNSAVYYFLIVLFVGFIFLRSGIEKLVGGEFVNNLPDILSRFAGNNPYPSVKSFLIQIAIPNSVMFGYIAMYGEIISGICLIIASIYFIRMNRFNKLTLILFVIGLTGSALMNDIYWLSSGWMNPSSETLNILMLFISLVGFAFIFKEILPAPQEENKMQRKI